jgi:integrase
MPSGRASRRQSGSWIEKHAYKER